MKAIAAVTISFHSATFISVSASAVTSQIRALNWLPSTGNLWDQRFFAFALLKESQRLFIR